MDDRKAGLVCMKDLIVFYSLEGNTKQAAEKIADKLNADILQLNTVSEIPKNKMKYIIGGMQAVFGVCPKIKPIGLNPEIYGSIVLGTPVWADKAAPAIHSFFRKYDVKDKVIALFTLSGGGDNEKCVQNLKKKFDHLQTTVSLADRKNPIASENDRKLSDFIEKLISTQREQA